MQCDSEVAALLIEQTLTQDSSTADVLDPAMVWLQAAEDGDTETTTKMLEDEAFTAVNIRFTKINMKGQALQNRFLVYNLRTNLYMQLF